MYGALRELTKLTLTMSTRMPAPCVGHRPERVFTGKGKGTFSKRVQERPWSGRQASPDESHTLGPHSLGYRTRQQWPVLRAKINAGKPAQLVLIRVEG